MATNPGLSRTQRWLQSFIIEPGTDEQALASDPVRKEFAGDVSEMVLPSTTLTSAQRTGVYRGMYLLRMEEALTTDYPVLKSFLGDDAFRDLVERYVQEHPSQSYTLNYLGRSLPAFIGETPDLPSHALPQRAFLRDLAAMELAFTEAFDEAETHVVTAEEIAQVPEDAWETARLKPIAALRLRTFDHAVSTFKEAYRDDKPFPEMHPEKEWMVIFRRDYAVLWITLAEPAFALLERLAGGTALGEAVEATCLQHESQVGEDELFAWFQEWVSNGFFQAVETAS